MSVAMMNEVQLIYHAQHILAFLRDGKGVRVDMDLANTLERLIRIAGKTAEGS